MDDVYTCIMHLTVTKFFLDIVSDLTRPLMVIICLLINIVIGGWGVGWVSLSTVVYYRDGHGLSPL